MVNDPEDYQLVLHATADARLTESLLCLIILGLND